MQTQLKKKLIAEHLWIPADTQAILWDMDGVLIDSLSLDLVVCNQFLAQHFDNHVTLSKEFIRSLFAYDPVKFWELILAFVEETYNIPNAIKVLDTVVKDFNQARHDCVFELNPGIEDILKAAHAESLKMAVVSNNLTEDVRETLNRSGILDYFESVVGNDIQQIAKKPAPDTYLLAASLLDVNPEKCVVVEDSLIGAEAGYHAKCYTIGVATGSAEFEVFEQAQWTQQVYSSFEINDLSLQFGDVRKKKIVTPNEFVSHMVEHIAWRLCVEIDLKWHNNDWWTLGEILGQQIRDFQIQENSAVALGMIDDGSAEVSIEIADTPALHLEAIPNLNLEWFLSLRCEQIPSGQPLVELAQGLTHGLGAQISIKVCSVEDPHHTWEGIFRSMGIALNKMFTPKHPAALPFDNQKIAENISEGEISVLANSLHYSKVRRGTAESHVEVAIDFSKQCPNNFSFNVDHSIDVSELYRLLEIFAEAAGFTMQVKFNATVLSSSHVVLEDIALVLGKALLEILTLRMVQWGVNGAGSSVSIKQDIETQQIRVGISVEGRKFWKFVPFMVSLDQVRQDFIIGHNIYNHLRSEDLDDFLDGLSGGLACSIIIHIDELIAPNEGWQLLFQNMGKALKEVFALNPYRKGVPPGVKATLS
jgi:HAD superfamily hydrolase (TIGR01509 family)